MREFPEQQIRNRKPEHGIPEKLHRLVVEHAAAHVFVCPRRVRQRVLEQTWIAEAVADDALEGVEFVAQRHDARAGHFGAMANDDALRLLRIVRTHGNPHVADAVHRERKDRPRHVG